MRAVYKCRDGRAVSTAIQHGRGRCREGGQATDRPDDKHDDDDDDDGGGVGTHTNDVRR